LLRLFAGRFDLPLSRDPSTKLLPWIVGLMVYLATLALAGALLLSGLLDDWNQGLSGKITVQVMPLGDETVEETQMRVTEAIRTLLKTPGIAEAKPIPLAEIAAMLEPWLGAAAQVIELPLPRLIDVTLEEERSPDFDALSQRLAEAVPGSTLDDHQFWRGQLVKLVRSLELLAGLVVGLVAIAAVAVVIFATRGGLAVHREIIEVLHLIGARDAYVADQFQRHAWRNCLRGGVVGGLFGVATLLGLRKLGEQLDPALLPPIEVEPWQWATLALVPVIASLIAMWTARRTVMRALARMV
jgi:cell division transport system permease protein